MKKEIKIEVPNDYSAITLRKYLELLKDLQAYEDEPQAINAALFYHLCGLTPDILSKIDTNTFTQIKNQLESFLNKQDWELIPFVKIGDKEYGFEPNLSEISYGAYLDISKFTSIEINDDWAKIMAILFRPVKKRFGKLYEIEGYTGREEWEHWLDVSMDVHFGAMFFFINLSKDLLKDTLNSTMMTTVHQLHYKQTLQRSGETILQSMNSLMETLQSMDKL